MVSGLELACLLVVVLLYCLDTSPFDCSDTPNHASCLCSGGETYMEVSRSGRICDKCISQALKELSRLYVYLCTTPPRCLRHLRVVSDQTYVFDGPKLRNSCRDGDLAVVSGQHAALRWLTSLLSCIPRSLCSPTRRLPCWPAIVVCC
jgi:hypothetical protein